MNYKFECSYSHGNVILEVENKRYNLGHNHVLKFPIMLWLAYIQLNQENLFEKISLPSSSKEIDYELEELVEDSITLAEKLPLSNGLCPKSQ